MPPANSPVHTRPSTPPLQSTATAPRPSLSATPYLQQLEEAISTPVPDLAATLNLTRSSNSPSGEPRRIGDQPSTNSRTEDAWDGRTVLHLSREDDLSDYGLERAGDDTAQRRSYLTETEFQGWTSESRQRVIMHSQRASLRETAAETTSERGGGDRYATTGGGPVRQRIYDWAATGTGRSRSRGLDNQDGDEGDPEPVPRNESLTNTDSSARRDLERALRNYRMARNALRSGRAPGSDVGAVPTASALRAYWNEESNEHDSTRLTTNYPGEMARLQLERERQLRSIERLHIEREREIRLREISRLRSGTDRHSLSGMASLHDTLRARRTSEAFIKVRSSIRYLSDVRTASVVGGLELARQLGLDSLYESDSSMSPSDLPMFIDQLPQPQRSSWLQPGMVWQGLQSTDRDIHPPVMASTLRRERQREYLRRAMVRRGLGNDDAGDDTQPPALTGTTSRLLDAERYLSDLLQDGSDRWNGDQLQQLDSTSGTEPHPPSASMGSDADHWPVNVTFHSVNLDDMTVSGTMTASHIPDKLAPSSPDHKPGGSSMESFFEGEIIDFRHHTLESEGKSGYRVGGVEIDAQYWQRIGPFKQEIERHRQSRIETGPLSKPSQMDNTKTWWRDIEDKSMDALNEADEIMARCLGSGKWLYEKLGQEWILMRWKERCFVTPNGSRAQVHPSSPSRLYTTSPADATAWGLTISGFYYVALNRSTGRLDGLYYDPGSQPYQQLDMAPMGMPLDDASPVGLKREFPSIEFR